MVDSDFPADTARLPSALQVQRLSADYDLSIPVDDWQEHDAFLAIDRSTRFVDEVEAWLIRNLPPGERFDLRRYANGPSDIVSVRSTGSDSSPSAAYDAAVW